MYVNFNDLNKNSKVWVFQSSSEIPELSLENISNDSKDFLDQLNSHGNSLNSSFKLIYNHFLIIAVENIKNEISGCSIDTITRFVKNLELKYNLSFFDRLILKYKKNYPGLTKFEGNVQISGSKVFEWKLKIIKK